MHRVVLTGLGAVSPCGLTVAETWDAVCHGRSGLGLITGWDTTDWAVRIGGQVSGFEPLDHFDRKQARRIERFVQFALVAAREAVADAGLPLDERLPVVEGDIVAEVGRIWCMT